MIKTYSRNLLVITAIGLAVRLVCLHVALPIELTGDEVYYATVAYNIADGHGHMRHEGMRASWPPANSYFLSMFISSVELEKRFIDYGEILESMLLAQAILGTLLVPLSMALARRLFDDRTAMAAGIITAFYPSFIAFSHYVWAENLFVVIVAAGLSAAVWTQETSRPAMAAVTGLLFGLATLTRETGFVIALACGVWWVWAAAGTQRRQALLRGSLMLAVMVLTVLPWTVRNYRVLGGFVPVSTVGWMAVSEGNILDPDDWLHPSRDLLVKFRTARGRITDELEQMEFSRRVALDLIRKEQPTWFLKKLVRTSGLMFGPDSFLFKKISRGTYGDVPLGVVRFLLAVTVLSYIILVVAGILGIALSPKRRLKMLPVLAIAALFLIHLMANASSRYRLPIVLMLIPYAGYAVTHLRGTRHRLNRRGWVVVAIAVAWFAAVCLPYFLSDAISLWDRGTYVSQWRP